MYDEILEQASKIVDGLSSYKQPILIYTVPNGELCEGAWVRRPRSYHQQGADGDVEARAAVFEPEGIIEIKMRHDKVLTHIERLDSTYATLQRDSKDASKTPNNAMQLLPL